MLDIYTNVNIYTNVVNIYTNVNIHTNVIYTQM